MSHEATEVVWTMKPHLSRITGQLDLGRNSRASETSVHLVSLYLARKHQRSRGRWVDETVNQVRDFVDVSYAVAQRSLQMLHHAGIWVVEGGTHGGGRNQFGSKRWFGDRFETFAEQLGLDLGPPRPAQLNFGPVDNAELNATARSVPVTTQRDLLVTQRDLLANSTRFADELNATARSTNEPMNQEDDDARVMSVGPVHNSSSSSSWTIAALAERYAETDARRNHRPSARKYLAGTIRNVNLERREELIGYQRGGLTLPQALARMLAVDDGEELATAAPDPRGVFMPGSGWMRPVIVAS